MSAKHISIDYDDSIIEDTGTKQVRAQSEVGAGLRSKKNYMTEIRGLGDKQAQYELTLIDSEKISNQELFGFPIEEKAKNNDLNNKKEKEKKKEEKKEEK